MSKKSKRKNNSAKKEAMSRVSLNKVVTINKKDPAQAKQEEGDKPEEEKKGLAEQTQESPVHAEAEMKEDDKPKIVIKRETEANKAKEEELKREAEKEKERKKREENEARQEQKRKEAEEERRKQEEAEEERRKQEEAEEERRKQEEAEAEEERRKQEEAEAEEERRKQEETGQKIKEAESELRAEEKAEPENESKDGEEKKAEDKARDGEETESGNGPKEIEESENGKEQEKAEETEISIEDKKESEEAKSEEEIEKKQDASEAEEKRKQEEAEAEEERRKQEEAKAEEEKRKKEEAKAEEEKRKKEAEEERKQKEEAKKQEKEKAKAEKKEKDKEKPKKGWNRIPFLDKHLEVNWISRDAKNREVKKQLNPSGINLFLEIMLIAFVALILVGVFGIMRFVILEDSIQEMNTQMEQIISEQESMIAVTEREKEELKDKISILTSQVAAQMVEKEEEAIRRIPTALPVTGKVVIISEPGDIVPNEDEPTVTPDPAETQIVILGVNEDSKILASASGTVKDIRPDERFGYCVEIDHGNDYVSLYYFNTEPKVKSGDEVLKGQLLFEVNANNGQMGYQVLFEGEYLNPVDLMEIKG